MQKEIITTTEAPAAIGSYAQGVKSGSLLFLSGQIPLDPKTGVLVGDDLDTQTRQVMKNIAALLAEAGIGFSHVLKAVVYLADLSQFEQFNAVYGSYFPADSLPARVTVEVSALPKGSLVEIAITACLS